MKKILIIATIIVFASCSTDDDSGSVNTPEFEQIETILPQGKWEVSKLIENDADSTATFESFDFTFKTDGSVIAQNDLFTENGTWAYDNESNDDDEELILQFTNTTPFNKINDDWDIISVSSSKIELKEDDGDENSETAILVFSKI